MLQFNSLTIEADAASCSGQWSPETIENGAKPKSHTSRRNFKIIGG